MPRKPTQKPKEIDNPLHAVVRIFTVSTEPRYSQPWCMAQQLKSSGTGFIIGERLIITNAHVVAHHTCVQIRKHGMSDKVTATVLAIAHDSDLAILTVDDEEFWEDTVQLPIGDMPHIRQHVTVIGYPMGGDTICVTEGVISRIDYDSYSHSSRPNLVAQVDAAINPGNSGGPALSEDGAVIGVAFQGMDAGDGIGYIIPSPILMHVLEDFSKNGRITGTGSMPFKYQTTENAAIRSSIGVPPHISGIRISGLYPASKHSEMFMIDDIVSEVDGIPIANDGTISISEHVRVPVSAIYSGKNIGDNLKYTVYRNKNRVNLSTVVERNYELVPRTLYEQRPSYYIFGGLVFTILSGPYVETRAENGSIDVGLLSLISKTAERSHQNIVVLSDILSHPINTGYEADEFDDSQLVAINDHKINNLGDVARICKTFAGEYIRFEFSSKKIIVLRTDDARASEAAILKANAINSAVSEDLTVIADEVVAVPARRVRRRIGGGPETVV